jgi:CxxC motif-containing protein
MQNRFDSGEESSVIKTIRCILCPTGCEIDVKKGTGDEVEFEGYTCKRGLEYAKQEYYEPRRVLTTTIRVRNGFLPLVPVRTEKAIPKEKIESALNIIAQKIIDAPIKMGDSLIKNIADTEIDLIASRNLQES